MSGHTPGPWRVEQTDPFGWTIYGQKGGFRSGTEVCALYGYGAETDARLIAATPDLLHVAKALVLWGSGEVLDPNDREAIVQSARDAIAKAEAAP